MNYVIKVCICPTITLDKGRNRKVARRKISEFIFLLDAKNRSSITEMVSAKSLQQILNKFVVIKNPEVNMLPNLRPYWQAIREPERGNTKKNFS